MNLSKTLHVYLPYYLCIPAHASFTRWGCRQKRRVIAETAGSEDPGDQWKCQVQASSLIRHVSAHHALLVGSSFGGWLADFIRATQNNLLALRLQHSNIQTCKFFNALELTWEFNQSWKRMANLLKTSLSDPPRPGISKVGDFVFWSQTFFFEHFSFLRVVFLGTRYLWATADTTIDIEGFDQNLELLKMF